VNGSAVACVGFGALYAAVYLAVLVHRVAVDELHPDDVPTAAERAGRRAEQ
jgi:hypothetical protein